jgi:hypothetical protein
MNDTPGLRALVVHESMFGNTSEVARAVADGLEREGLEVSLTRVRDAAPADSYEFDVLVVGAPTHAFSLSRASTRADAVRQGAPAVSATGPGVREWLAAMTRPAAPRLAAAFDTRVTRVRRVPKTASSRAVRLLRHHGFRVVQRPTGFLVHDMAGPLEDGELVRATDWGRTVGASVRESTHAHG